MPATVDIDGICLNLTSQSGTYVGVAGYFGDDGGGPRTLPYASEDYQDYLEALEEEQMGLLIETSACDDRIEGPFLIGAWRSRVPAEHPEITVMVNSKGSDMVAVQLRPSADGEPGEMALCSPVEAGQRRGYDFVCRATLLPAYRQTIEIHTVGFGGTRNPPVTADIIVH
jgi:hypothetical protein